MNPKFRLKKLREKKIMLKESRTWLCWPIIMRDKNLVAGCFHIGIKIGVSKNYCEKNLLNSYCISEILTIFSKIPNGCRLMPKTRLPVLNLIAPILAKNKLYIGQEPP